VRTSTVACWIGVVFWAASVSRAGGASAAPLYAADNAVEVYSSAAKAASAGGAALRGPDARGVSQRTVRHNLGSSASPLEIFIGNKTTGMCRV
jgi:hypothetical protein